MLNKKFLMVLALVAMLVAAMAGTAFAQLDVARSADVGTSMGTVKAGGSFPVYFFDNTTTSADVAISVSIDYANANTEAASDDIVSVDVEVLKAGGTPISVSTDVASDDINGDAVSFDFKVYATDLPTTEIRVTSSDKVVDSADFVLKAEVFTVDVLKAFVADENLESDSIVISEDLNNNYTYGSNFGLVVDGIPLTTPSMDILSHDGGYVEVSFDAATSRLGIARFGVASGDMVVLTVSADQLIPSADQDAKVAGFTPGAVIAKITVSATPPTPPTVEPTAEDVNLGTGYTEITPALFGLSKDTSIAEPEFDVEDVQKAGETKAFKIDVTGFGTDTAPAAVALTATLGESNLNPAVVSNDFDNWVASSDKRIAMLRDNGYALEYNYVEGDSLAPAVLVYPGGWEAASNDGYVVINASGVTLNYVVVNGEGAPTVSGDRIYIPDGAKNNTLSDPVLMSKGRTDPGSSSSSGCDAGFGAFALFGLAGLALLRRKG